MTLNILLILYIIVLCLLILFIILNKSKGAEIGASFTNTNTEILNIKESNSIIRKIIITLAILALLLIISISLVKKIEINKHDTAIVSILKK